MHPHAVIESVDDVMVEVLRSKTAAERLQIAFGLWRSAREMLTAMVRAEHPEWTDDEAAVEVARRLSHGAL